MNAIVEKKQIEQVREKVLLFESVLKALPQVDIPIKHYLAPGLYLREMFMPKGVCITGKIHKTEHFCILAQGSVTVVGDNGPETLTAPAVIHSMPGAKRAINAHEDSVWINVHHNPKNETNLDKIDDVFVVDTFDQYLEFTEQKKLEGDK